MIVWYGLWAALFTSLVGFLASWWWLTQEPSPEPTAALYASAAVFIVSVIGLPIQYFFNEERQKRSKADREKRREVFDWVLDRLDGEMKNLRQIESKRVYSGESHRKAVEDSSFELLAEEIEKLLGFFWYRKSARQILDEIARIQKLPPNGKDVHKIIPMLEALRPRLEADLKRHGGPAEM